jgi:hypothetical protein
MCQLASGAPVMAFGTVPFEAFESTGGEPKRRRSSSIAERWFCGDCGTQIAIHADYQPDTLDIALVTLDDPSLIAPEFHIWTLRQIPWFDIADNLPRYGDFRPDTRGQPDEAVRLVRTERGIERGRLGKKRVP